MKHKLLRGLVALVLVCVLVVNVSPIRVSATGSAPVVEIIKQTVPFFTGGAASGGAALGSAVFGYVAAGLGVVIGGVLLSDLVERYQAYSGELDVSIYYYPDGTWSYGVDMGFIERVRAFLFEHGYLVDTGCLTTVVPEGVAFRNYTPNGPCVAYMYSYSYYVTSRQQHYFAKCGYLVCTVPDFKLTVNGKSYDGYITYNDRNYYYYGIYQSGTYYNEKELSGVTSAPSEFYYLGDTGTTYSLRSVIKKYGWSGVQGAGDIAIDYVASPDVAIDVGYPDWYTNARPAGQSDSDEEIIVLPIPLNPSADPETQVETLTQTDIWQGSIEEAPAITPPVVMPETVGLADIWQLIKGIPAALADVITGPLVGGLTKIGDLIKSIPQAIAEAISAIFVPREDFLTAKWEAIRAEFAFADSIMTSGDMILGVLNGIDPEPPVIYIDLGASEGSYDIGGEVPFLDLRWYERYKPTGDAIISAFLWLVFVWRMFIKLPGIIGGLPGDFVMQGVVNLGLSEHLPARKKEYEYVRQQNRRSMKK